jgi:hypothetical protein
MKYTNSVDPAINFGRGTIPDHLVEINPIDVIEKKDVVMEFALTLID